MNEYVDDDANLCADAEICKLSVILFLKKYALETRKLHIRLGKRK